MRRRETRGGLRGRGPSVARGLQWPCSQPCCSPHWRLPLETLQWYWSISLFTSSASRTEFNFSPPAPLLLPSPTNHRIGGQGQSRSHRYSWVPWTSDSDWSWYGWVIPKEFDPTFQFKDIAFTCSVQVHFLPIVLSSISPSSPPLSLLTFTYLWNSVHFAHRSRSWDKSQCSLTWRSTRTSCGDPTARSSMLRQWPASASSSRRSRMAATHVWGQGELAVWWTETKNCHRMYLFFSCIFFCDFRFLNLIFNFYLLIYYIQARALIRNPKLLLLLDEAISALSSIQFESQSEKIVQFAIDKASQGEGRTTVTFARKYFPLSPYIYIYIYIYMNIFIFILKILTLVQLPEGLCPLYESRRIALTPQSPRTSPRQRNKPLPITIISHIQPFLP